MRTGRYISVEPSADTEDDYSELMALFQKLGTGALRAVAIEQFRVLTKYSEEDI